tara:strand:- start:1679 stop:2674 length:996 start_codon:yes stop_codon:yes gene_type:complete
MVEEEPQETESSTVSEEVQVDESTTEEVVAEDTASPSDATEVEEETQTLEEAVQDALQSEEPVEETETSEETEVTEPIGTSEETPSEDYKDVPFNKHPRFRSLVAEKNELKETNEKLQNDSEQYSKITGFIDRNNLSAKDAVEGFKIMAAIRNDPNVAYQMLEHHLNNVSKITGKVLPEDIQEKLDDGFLDEDAAKELSQTRASLAREQHLRKTDQARGARQQSEVQSDLLSSSLQTWGENTLAKDPDFGLKQEEFNDRVIALVNERGRPQTQADVLGLVEDAYGTVNERFKARQPQPTQLRTATGGKLSGTPRAEPKSLSDAISMAYESS